MAIEYAARHPRRLAGLVLVNCYATYRRRPGYPHGLDEATTRELIDTTIDPARDRPVDTAAMVAPSLAGDAGFRDWWARIGRRGGGPGIARTVRESGTGLDLRGRLGEVRVPVLVVHRRHCTNVDPGHSRFLADAAAGRRPFGSSTGSTGCGSPKPDDVLAEVNRFLRRTAQS